MKIAILEDDSRRIRRMVRCLQERFPSCEAAVFDAPEMIGWLNDHLPEVQLICLDHDLGANHVVAGEVQDPGTGRDVADYLGSQRPCCPVLIHSTNLLAVPGMMMALEDADWKCSALSPFNDLEWVRTAWIADVIEALGQA